MLYVENLPSIDIPEIIRVELPQDDSVVITGVTEADVPAKSCKETRAEEAKAEDKIDEPMPAKRTQAEPEVPVYWTKCKKCRRSTERRYHLVDVLPNSHEWLNVCSPFLSVDFAVQRLARIQNQSLWHRLQCERQLMCRSHVAGFDLNERLLYHTSRAKPELICAEGLDQRLGAVGSFGRGIYFSDNPRKCDMYWHCHSQSSSTRKMFACRVLLGDIKVYAAGKVDHSLVREPSKPGRRGHQAYDSVLGNKGFNEFVVYNTYRVMPEYVIEYEGSQIPPQIAGASPTNPYASRPSLPMCHMCGDLTTVCRCRCMSN
jgi:hypothetical protein